MPGDRRTLEPGKRLNIPERVKKREKQFREPGSSLRQTLTSAGERFPINPPNENVTPNTFAGAIGTYLVYVAEDYLPVRLGADVSISDVQEISEDRYEYTVNVNAPLEGQARFKAIMQAGTGAVSLWVDDFTIEDYKVIKKRPARDTYQYKIIIEEN